METRRFFQQKLARNQILATLPSRSCLCSTWDMFQICSCCLIDTSFLVDKFYALSKSVPLQTTPTQSQLLLVQSKTHCWYHLWFFLNSIYRWIDEFHRLNNSRYFVSSPKSSHNQINTIVKTEPKPSKCLTWLLVSCPSKPFWLHRPSSISLPHRSFPRGSSENLLLL